MEYYSTIKRTDIGSFVEMWLDLARVCHTECSKSEGENNHILTHICGILSFRLWAGSTNLTFLKLFMRHKPSPNPPNTKMPFICQSPASLSLLHTTYDLLTTGSSYLTPDLSHYMQNCWWLLFIDLWVSPQKKAMMQLLVWLCFRVITVSALLRLL